MKAENALDKQTDLDDLFFVGHIVGFHGVEGEVKVKPETNNLELLLSLKNMIATVKDCPEPLKLKVKSARADRRLIYMRFVGLKDRNAVEAFAGASLHVLKSELPPLSEEEFWVKDLVGLNVFTTDGKYVGKVRSIIYGGNDVLEIYRDGDPEDKTILVPFVKDLVPLVDIKGCRLEVVDLPGLLEPQ